MLAYNTPPRGVYIRARVQGDALNPLVGVQEAKPLEAFDFRAPRDPKCGYLEHFAGNFRCKMSA